MSALQMYNNAPRTVRLDSVKLTNAGARPELAELQTAGDAHRSDMPSVEIGCSAPWFTNTVASGLFATRVLALPTAHYWSRRSHRELGKDRVGKQ